MELNSTPKLPNGLTPMLETNVDILGLITSMMLMLLLLILGMKSNYISTPPSIKVLMTNLGVSLT